MSDRYTRKDAEAAFARLASRMGKQWAVTGAVYEGNYWEPRSVGLLWQPASAGIIGRPRQNIARVGTWTLDYNPVYGGYVIEEILNQGGGVTQPFGPLRRSAREFCEAVRFAETVLAALKVPA